MGFDQENPLTPMLESMLERTHPDYQSTSDIKWNFTKFLIDRDGNVVERFEPTTDMYEVEQKDQRIIVGDEIMRYNYLTENTCSQMISFDLDGNVVTNIKYMGGCDGNLQSIERILDGWTVEEIEQKLGDIKCGRRPTSCSGQLAIAVRKAYDGLLEPEEE